MQLFSLAIAVLACYLLFKNFVMYKRVKLNKRYVNCFNEMFKEGADAHEVISAYIESEENIEFKNKGRIFKLFIELRDGLSYEETLEALDLKELFYSKDKVDYQKINFSSDSFCWILTSMIKAEKVGAIDVINGLIAKLEMYEEAIGGRLEYAVCKAVREMLLEEGDKGVALFENLLAGEYEGYTYDKRLIGLYKRISAVMLVHDGHTIEEYDEEDIHTFATSMVGRFILEDLDLYEKYKPVPVEETSEEAEDVEMTEEETTDVVEEENGEETSVEEESVEAEETVEETSTEETDGGN